jgi:hypothetical protein
LLIHNSRIEGMKWSSRRFIKIFFWFFLFAGHCLLVVVVLKKFAFQFSSGAHVSDKGDN